MALRLSYCPYRLEFKHPFGTSHGVRTGTDSIFIKLQGEGAIGYGEVTLPPYLKEKPAEVVQRLEQIGAMGSMSPERLKALLEDPAFFNPANPGCRAGLQMALSDWIATIKQVTITELFNVLQFKRLLTLVTIGITPVSELAVKLSELPESGALKLKVQGEHSVPIIRIIRELDHRKIFLDGNQGMTSLEEAMVLAVEAGERLLGLEQPFPVSATAMQAELQQRLPKAIFGDESIQNIFELEDSIGQFNGVNIKLVKCGGIDRAKAMADRAGELGKQVMLGSMSESSLGCTAMAHLAGQADLIDLDGPWLLRNDPFTGIEMEHGKLTMPDRPGIGAVLIAPLQFIPICA